jgi:hypothetical protein
VAVASWGRLRMISPGLFAVPDVWARREGGAAKAGAHCAGEFQELEGSFCQTMMDTMSVDGRSSCGHPPRLAPLVRDLTFSTR